MVWHYYKEFFIRQQRRLCNDSHLRCTPRPRRRRCCCRWRASFPTSSEPWSAWGDWRTSACWLWSATRPHRCWRAALQVTSTTSSLPTDLRLEVDPTVVGTRPNGRLSGRGLGASSPAGSVGGGRDPWASLLKRKSIVTLDGVLNHCMRRNSKNLSQGKCSCHIKLCTFLPSTWIVRINLPSDV